MTRSYRLIWAILTPQERLRFLALMGLSLTMALFELVSVAGILPLLSMLANPDLVETNRFLVLFADLFGLETYEDTVIGFGVAVLCVVLMSALVRASVTYIQIRFATNRGYTLASRLLHTHLGQHYDWHITRNTARLSQSLLSEVDTCVRDSILPAVMLISNGFILSLFAVFLFYADPLTALVALTVLVTVYGATFLSLRKHIRRIGKIRIAANGRRFKVIQEVTGSLKDIKVMGLERIGLGRFRDPARTMARAQATGLVLQRLPRFALEAVVYGGLVFIVVLLTVVREGDVADLLPILGLLALSATKLFPALQHIYANVSALLASQPVLERLRGELDLLKDTPPLPLFEGPVLPLKQALTFDRVSFRYPEGERTTLQDVSLEIPAYASIGVVGGTGAGKTTVIDLMLGLLRPESGTIAVDGTPLTADTIRSWQRNIGYVPQSIFLSDDTVSANIAFGLPPEQIDQAQVERAAKMANLHDFVMAELPLGYDTMVGERGLRLSGGQRQRVGIARALYHDPDVLIMDEATSALDNLTERAVMEAVRGLSGQKTIIMIAHRLTTVQDCDKILFFEHGQLVDEGPFAALVDTNQNFRAIAEVNG